MTGSMVERASGSRRVRKSWAAWRYVFAICVVCGRCEAESDVTDVSSMVEEERASW